MKQCGKCKETKPLDAFHKQSMGRYGVHSHCKTCKNKATADSYSKQRELIRENNIKRNYGINIQTYNNMYTAQDGKCAICTTSHKTLFIDHDHQTGHVRGLLCRQCNLAFGLLKENINTLQKMIEYKQRHFMWRWVG